MTFDSTIYDRVVFVGGKVSGIDCPECDFETRETEIESHSLSPVTCPNCGATILSTDQKSTLRQAHKL